ncbi:outer spore coat protein CotE [Mechercharimyces sp. CAU 1602]|uniref:outer spore coat protein CotE n=1 Tax=Mechercharimyces sp. CAU 1602 TaxID=2973933 RepID=UPI002162A8CE|nr:outer spore coat protein CotE [Mechercharimyces sp. CAU 1602]MCS1351212.1 outer spore coat protein CotE [Mechercharimyces sp. CAU 1602]
MSARNNGMQYRHIVTKAVCGKGRKFSNATHTIHPPEGISSVLGAWIINHSYDAMKRDDTVEVTGSYDVNVWYSYEKNTKTDVMKETVHYVEQIPLSDYDRSMRDSHVEVSALAVQAPNCVEATISGSGNSILVRVEREFSVEMLGDRRVCIAVYPSAYDDLDDKGFDLNQGSGQEFEELDPDDLVIDDLDN